MIWLAKLSTTVAMRSSSTCTAITSIKLIAVLITLVIVSTSVDRSEGLPSSPVPLKTKLLSHVIRSRSLGRSQKYCGPNIVRILNLLCDGQYFSHSKRKQPQERDDSKQNQLNNGIAPIWDDMTPKADYIKPEEDESADDYFLEPEKAFDMLSGQRQSSGGRESAGSGGTFIRKRRGIVDECCKKPCTINELVSYCE